MEANDVAKGTFKITSTEIIRYLSLASFYVVVTRTGALTETDLGRLSILIFLGSLIPTLTGLGLPTALAKYVSESRKKNEEMHAAIIRKTVNTSVLALSTLGLVISILLSGPISLYFWKSETYASLIILMSFYAYFQALMQLFNSNLQAFFLFGARAMVTIVWVVVSTFLGAFLAYINFGVHGVMFGYITGYGTAFVISFLFSREKVSSPNGYMPLRPLLKFSLPLFLSSIVLLGLDWADIVVLARITSNYDALGIYYLAVKSVTFLSVLYLPVSFTILPLLSAQHGVKDFKGLDKTLKTVSRYIHYLMLPSCVGLAIIAPTALRAIYGQQYASGSASFAVLSLAQILVAFYWILTTMLTAIGKTSAIMKINIVSVSSYIALLLLFVPLFADVGAASARLVMQAIGFAMMIYLLNKNVKVGVDKESLWKSTVASMVFLPVLILTERILASFSVYLILIVDMGVAAGLYLLLLYLLKALGHQDFELLRRTFPSLTKYIDIVDRIMVREAKGSL